MAAITHLFYPHSDSFSMSSLLVIYLLFHQVASSLWSQNIKRRKLTTAKHFFSCKNAGATTLPVKRILFSINISMFIYIKRTLVNLLPTYNIKRRNIKLKYQENEKTLA